MSPARTMGDAAADSDPALPTVAGFSLPEAMRAELEAAPKLSRSEMTRRRLMIAAAELIQDAGFGGLKVADICKRADFAHGTFYLHWKDRRGVAHDVLTAFMEAIRTHRPQRRPMQSFYQRLMAGQLYYIDVYRRNVGLMRCQGQLADELDSFAELGLKANLGLAHRIVRAAAREEPALEAQPIERRLGTALACIAMVDKLLHEVFARGLDLGLDDVALAEMLSLSWHRTLLGRDPSADIAPVVSPGG
ncbi:TetR/AcrR family transcriptional regulator [Hyphomicrobiales bacterium]|nr:TetR/AcrR family transcriptional regulator [Hyphomicrobiales bacterium]CAH1699244.1 TetR/AcrR family transcriptional regulator [Hyphomicrobiales bacterium]CAI0343031.1 TetR/AcrR family transcriptional regulator [Hyphomicrobiales bacterium]